MTGGWPPPPPKPPRLPLPALLLPPLALPPLPLPALLLPPELVPAAPFEHLPQASWQDWPSQVWVHQPYCTACTQVSPLLGGRLVHGALTAPPLLVVPAPLLTPPSALTP